MGRLNKLGSREFEALLKPGAKQGRYSDGGGLYLLVGAGDDARSWIIRVNPDGKRRELGLGSAGLGNGKLSLAKARAKANNVREQVADGKDPLDERRRQREAKRALEIIPNFEEAARSFHREHKKTCKNGKHVNQWIATLEAHAFPHIGEISVAEVTEAQVRDVLAKIWLTIPETARRVRQRINAVIDWSCGKGYRRLPPLHMGIINRSLPKQKSKGKPFPAMPWTDVPAFVGQLADPEKETMSRLALQALILTGARSGEIRGARWSEVDLDAGLWSIPGERMKKGRPHIVPLSEPALAVFRRAHALRTGELCFEGRKQEKPMSDGTMRKLMLDMGITKETATVHGFRGSFSTWANDEEAATSEVVEAALSHGLKNKVEASYNRSTYFERRKQLMVIWGSFVAGNVDRGNVVPLRA